MTQKSTQKTYHSSIYPYHMGWSEARLKQSKKNIESAIVGLKRQWHSANEAIILKKEIKRKEERITAYE